MGQMMMRHWIMTSMCLLAHCNGRKLPGPEMCRILGRKLPGPEMKVLESGTRLGDEGSPGTDRLTGPLNALT
jgi:hypothetical protein